MTIKAKRPVSEAPDVARGVAARRSSKATSKRQPPPPAPPIDPATLPEVYGMQLRGDCLEPVLPDGATIMLRKSDPIAAGDFVCIYFRDVKPGDPPAFMKRTVLGLPHGIKLPYVKNPKSECHPIIVVEQMNPPAQYLIDCADVIAVHKAVAYGPPAASGQTTASSANMLPIPVDH